MSKLLEDLLYLPLDMENPPNDFIDWLEDLQFKNLYQDDYRNCFHVPIMFDMNKGNFKWTPWAYQVPQLREWCEDVLFPLTGKSRIMIITTPSGDENPAHIDCSEEMFTTLQHKFRYVLQGNVDDLEFIGEEATLKPTSVDKPFIMSGKWPHKMKNTTNKTKFTFALGAPWDGSVDDNNYVSLIERSYKKYETFYLENTLQLPNNYKSLFESEYNYRQKAKDLLSEK